MQSQKLLLVLTILTAPTAAADIWYVLPDGSGDFPTIQAAIDGSVSGDLILLADGYYAGEGNYNLDYRQKAITISSLSENPEACMIDCNWDRGVSFVSGEGPTSILEAVTIMNGAARYGSAIHCTGSSPYIRNCILRNNSFPNTYPGGCVLCINSSPTFDQCVFKENESREAGIIAAESGGTLSIINCAFIENVGCLIQLSSGASGAVEHTEIVDNWTENWSGIRISSASLQMSHCTFRGSDGSSGASGICCMNGSLAEISNCTFYNLLGGDYQGRIMICESNAHIELNSCIIAFNRSWPVHCDSGGSFTIACSDIYGNVEGGLPGNWIDCIEDQVGVDGNIEADPEFCNASSGDLTLQDTSPCAPFSPPNAECDLIGAWPVGCSGTPANGASWGQIKALYR